MGNFAAVCAVSLAVAGCSSVEVISQAPAIPDGKCSVKVYKTRKQAEKDGEIEELCIINGTSSGSWSHTVAVAVEKHKGKACACGADKVYIESRHEPGLDMATVSMVAFKHTSSQRQATDVGHIPER